MPARVAVTVTVMGENPEEGLAAAHDCLTDLSTAQTVVESLDVDSATLGAFVRAPSAVGPEGAGDCPPSPLSYSEKYRFESFSGYDDKTPRVTRTEGLSFEAAKARTRSLQPTEGFGQVTDFSGRVLHFERAKRGGFEVIGVRQIGQEDLVLDTWLPTAEAARRRALKFRLNKQMPHAEVKVYDNTDRSAPPVVIARLS